MNTHSHHHHHHPGHGRALVIGIVLNSAFVMAEIFYGLQANSLALLADAGHNAGDVLTLFIALGATLLAKRAPSPRFTYGLQSASIIAALANALLLTAAIGGIGWEALQRFAAPPEPQADTVIMVAAAGVLVNGITACFFTGHRHDLNIHGAFLHMVADAAISLGVVISALVMLQTGWLWLDPLVSLAISVIILFSSWRLLKGSLRLALQAVPENIDTAAVQNYLSGLQGVTQAHDLHIWAMSTSETAMSAHLLMPGGHPGDGFIKQVAHELETRFHISHATLQIEIGDIGADCQSGCTHA